MATQELAPLRMGTRQRIHKVASKAFSTGEEVTFDLPRVGLLNGIFVRIKTKIDASGASTVKTETPWSLANRFTLITNQGTANIIDVSGYGAHINAPARNFGVDYTGESDLYQQFSASGSASDVDTTATWFLPVSVNDGRQFDVGMINLQAPEIQVTFNVRCGALADIGSNVTDISGTIEVFYRYYEIPDPRLYMMPSLTVIRTLESVQTVGAVGEQIYTVPRQGILLNMAHLLKANGAYSDGWDYAALRFNKTDEPYRIDRWMQRALEANRYGTSTPTGVILWDFFHAFGEVNAGDVRDAIDTEELSTTEAVVNVASGTTLGTNNNSLTTIRRIMQVLE